MSKFPGWRFGPQGEARVFQSEADVPKGWTDVIPADFPKPMEERGPVARLDPLDHDGDGEKGGSTSGAEDAKSEVRALREEYRKKMGKRPFSGWGAAELRRRMA